jgi:hypothetical protein
VNTASGIRVTPLLLYLVKKCGMRAQARIERLAKKHDATTSGAWCMLVIDDISNERFVSEPTGTRYLTDEEAQKMRDEIALHHAGNKRYCVLHVIGDGA